MDVFFIALAYTDPDDIVLGPPRTSFPSTTPFRTKLGDSDRPTRDPDGGPRERLGFRSRNNDDEGDNDRYREGRGTNYRRRDNNDLDSDGWSTVKPRKSLGPDGAERLQGRAGGDRNNERSDRFGPDRRPRDRDDRERDRDRPQRNFDSYSRDRDGDNDVPRRNGLSRARSDAPWHKDTADGMSQREKIEKSKNWRERDVDSDVVKDRERGHERYDRRWNRDREQKQEAEPEWMDEPVDGSAKPKMNQEDFVKFMRSLKERDRGPASSDQEEKKTAEKPAQQEPEPEFEKPKQARSEPVEEAPQEKTDKFFEKYAAVSATPAEGTANSTGDPGQTRPKIGAVVGKTTSRFTSFWSASNRQADVPTQATNAPPPPQEAASAPALSDQSSRPNSDSEKAAFQMLLLKLQSQSIQNTSSPPATGSFQQPPSMSAPQDTPSTLPHVQQHVSPDPFGSRQHPTSRREDTRTRIQPPPVQMQQDVVSPRPIQGLSNPIAMRSEQQILQEFVSQRQNAQSQGSARHDQSARNQNAEFLMGLMQSARGVPEPRTEELMARMQQQQQQQPPAPPPPQQHQPQEQQKQQQQQQQPGRQQTVMPGTGGREAEFLRTGPQRPMGRGPLGFMDEQFHPIEQDRQQPPHILQRPPPPPRLDNIQMSWMGPGGPGVPGGPSVGSHSVGSHVPGSQRPMIPPPGLPGPPGNPPRSAPPPGMGPNMFLPNFPGGTAGFHESVVGPPPRNMQPPPGLFGGPAFPGVPHPSMGGFQGPDNLSFGGQGGPVGPSPGDGRGVPPPFMRRP